MIHFHTKMMPRRVQSSNWLLLFLVLAIAITAFGLSIYLMVRDKGNIRLIQGVPPIHNEVFNLEGPGISVSPDIPGHSITFGNTGVLSNIAGDGISVSSATGDVTISNTGVLTVNNRSPISGNILISSTASGINIANGVASNEIVVFNTGVIQNIAGTGIAVSSATGSVTISNTGILSVSGESGISASTTSGAVTVAHDLTVQTALADSDANGPHVRYTGVASGLGNWTETSLTIEDGGQGAVGSNVWQIPSIGLYDVRAHCTTDGNATDYQMIHAALTFGATDPDPTEGGAYIAGRSSTGIPALYDSFASIQVSALVHAGCSGCPVSVGEALNLHILVPGAESLLNCNLQVSKLI